MKQFKRLFAVAVFFMTALSMSSQCFIRTVDGKHYWCENKIENIKDVDEIVVSQNKILTRIPKKDVVLIEYEEYGVEILQPDKLDKVEPKACNRNYESFLARGKSTQRNRPYCVLCKYHPIPCIKEWDFFRFYLKISSQNLRIIKIIAIFAGESCE